MNHVLLTPAATADAHLLATNVHGTFSALPRGGQADAAAARYGRIVNVEH
jgi:hypothetical protein